MMGEVISLGRISKKLSAKLFLERAPARSKSERSGRLSSWVNVLQFLSFPITKTMSGCYSITPKEEFAKL